MHQNPQLTISGEFCLVFSAGLRMRDIYLKIPLEEFIGLQTDIYILIDIVKYNIIIINRTNYPIF